MTKQRVRPWMVLIAFLLAILPACALAEPPAFSAAPASPLAQLAEHGDFDGLLASIRTAPKAADDANVAALVRELERYRDQQQAMLARRQEAHLKALDALERRTAAGTLDTALVSAIEAHGLAEDPEAFLADPRVETLIETTERAIAAAEETGDWVEVVSLYRALDMLFEDHPTYKEPLRQAARHLNVLRVYLPGELERLLRDRARRVADNRAKDPVPPDAGADGEDAELDTLRRPESIHVDKEPWQQRLEGVDMPLLMETLNTAARRHVSSRGYTTQLLGAIDGLSILVDTQGIEAAFPAVADDDAVGRFRAGLANVRAGVERGAASLDAADGKVRDAAASAVVDRVVALNSKTLRLPRAVLAYEMSEGALGTLDEFSAVIWPRETEAFARNFQGEFFGVGIQIAQKYVPKMGREQLVVVSPLEGTPAQRAGIRADDVIATVNGRDTTDWTLDQAVREITGPEGTTVKLGIVRTGERDLLEFRLKRAKIPIESIRGWEHRAGGGWDYFIDPQQKIGYVRLTQFIPQTASDLDAAINQMQAQGGLRALILDLRFNPGGLLSAAVEVTDRFIPSGTIVSTVGPSDRNSSSFKARRDRTHPAFPIVVLINQGSASASEIVSGALQDYGRALIVGTRSYGKGSVQDVFQMEGPALLKLTTQYYKLPKDRIIHRRPDSTTWGIEPDLKVVMTPQEIADWLEFRQQVDVLRAEGELRDPENPVPLAAEILDKGMDPQLSTALLVLKARLVADRISLAQGEPAAATP